MSKQMNLCCWSCGKEYPFELYRLNDDDKYVECDCGGIVVSRSGKIMGISKEVFEDE